METYHKISTPFKRHFDGPDKGKLIHGAWAAPEFEYLADNLWELTEKVDGTNIRIGFDPFVHPEDQVQFKGRTDNASIPTPLLMHLEATFNTDLFYKAFGIANNPGQVILFGEGYGPKIQGGGKYRGDHSFVLFDVLINGFWLTRNNVNDIAAKLGIESVPVIGHGTLHDAINIVKYGLNGHTIGLGSIWGDFEAEGIVATPTVPMFNRKGERIITKVKSVDFR